MLKYQIFNRDGVKVAEHEYEESQAPALLAGHTAHLVEEVAPVAPAPTPDHPE